MIEIILAGTFAASLEDAVRRHLTVPGNITLCSEAEVAARLDGADVLVGMAFTAAMRPAARRLKLVQVPGAGLDRVDRTALPPGTWLANVYGHETGIAEYAIGAMLSLTREFERLDSALRRHEWHSQWAVGTAPPPTWPELAGRTLGIFGYGRIGQAIARRAGAFDMIVRGIRRDVAQSQGDALAEIGGPETLEAMLREADYLIVAVPASPQTIGAIGREQLRLMKPSAFLINVARAEIVDEQALYDALAAGTIAGAALDVWYRYPDKPGPCAPATCPFYELPNVLMTPHIAGWTDGMMRARARLIAENIRRASVGEAPLNLVATGAG